MMKIVFALLLVSLCYVHAELSAEQLAKLKDIIKECKEKHEVTDEDIDLLKQHKTPETQTGKCFSACIKKKLGVLDADNKVDIARVTELLEHVKEKDEAKFDGMIKVFNTCAAEVPGGSDECEVATKLSECVHREFDANGIKVDLAQVFNH